MEDRTVFQPPANAAVRPGVRLNGVYEIESLIGEGGMGEVYKGFSVQTRDPVAIKMIRPEMSRNPDAIALFRREASTLHTLQHDAIVRYYVFSVDPDLQRAYLAMEYVDGVALSERLKAGPLSLPEVRILKNRIAGALDAAHRLGVVHRDISPDNFILPNGDVRQVKVIDFGIARSRRAGEGTIIGDSFAGKNKYASPEQLSGEDVTFKSDIYSLGLVLTEALRGRRIELVERRRKVPDLSDINPIIRPLLQAMLQPEPADRPASMAAVAAWNEALPAGSVSNPRPLIYHRPPARRRSSSGLILAAVSGLMALASVVATLYIFRDDVAGVLGFPEAPVGRTPGREPSRPTAGESPVETPTPARPTTTAGRVETPPIPARPTTISTPIDTPIPTTAGPIDTPTTSPAPPSTTGSNETPPLPPKASGPIGNQILTLLSPLAPPSTTLPQADVGKPYREELPAFTDPAGQILTLETSPAPPDGLTLEDLGSGNSAIKGTPRKEGQYEFGVTATNRNAQSARMKVTIVVAPPSEAQGTPAQRLTAFLRDFDGGPCWFVRPVPSPQDSNALQAFSSDASAFARFVDAYRTEFGTDPLVSNQIIDQPQCPALELLRLAGRSAVPAPRVELAAVEAGSKKPLAGIVSGLAGRSVNLVLVENDGSVDNLPYKASPDGDSAQFTVGFDPEPDDVGHALGLLVIVSDKPIPALHATDLGKADELLPKLTGIWAEVGGSADAQFARMIK